MKPFRQSDFASRVAAGSGLGAAGDRGLTRFAPVDAPVQVVGGRTFTFVFSDESIDRFNDVIYARGWQLDNFNANPICLFGHDASSVENVVGRAKNVRVQDKRLVGDIEFMGADVNPNAEAVYQMVRGGYLRTVSVGFAPIEWEASKDKSRPGGVDFKKSELLEISIVPLPANPNALVQAKAAGIDTSVFARLGGGQFQMDKNNMTLHDRQLVARLAAAEARAHKAALTTARGSVTIASDGGFKSFGEFAAAVARKNVTLDSRLVRAQGASEGSGPDGGFLVAPDLANGVIQSVFAQSVLLPLVDHRKSDRPSDFKLNAVDEQSRKDGSRSGGAISYFVGEGNTIPTSFPRFRQISLSSKKIVAMAAVTDELLSDAAGLEGVLLEIFGAELGFRGDLAVLAGQGGGQPAGILSSPALIVQPKDVGQASNTLSYSNITGMWSRCAAPCRKNAVWLIQQDIETQLFSMSSASGAGGVPVYLPADSEGSGYGTLFGRPVICVEQCSPISTQGDVVLVDPSQYVWLDGGERWALSLDVSFVNDQAYFRMTWRVDGSCKWATPTTPYNSTLPRSPYIALAAR